MTDELDVDAFLFVQLHFEREDYLHLVNQQLHLLHTSLIPCPHLRADVVQHSDVPLSCLFCKPEIKPRVINQDEHVWSSLIQNSFQFGLDFSDQRKMFDHLHESHEREG